MQVRGALEDWIERGNHWDVEKSRPRIELLGLVIRSNERGRKKETCRVEKQLNGEKWWHCLRRPRIRFL